MKVEDGGPTTGFGDPSPVPQRLQWLEVDGVSTRVVEHGDPDAPAIILIHGTGGHLEAFDRNVEALSRVRRVIRYDLPGHGWSSTPPDRSYEIDGYVRHLEALMDALGIASADMIGQSLGGWISGRLALDSPGRLGRMVLVAPGGVLEVPAAMSRLKSPTNTAAMDITPESVRARLEWLMADPEAVPDWMVDVRLAIYRRPEAADAMDRVLCLQEPQTRARNLMREEHWRRVTAPTLVFWGEADRTGPARTGVGLAGWLPHGRYVPTGLAGHWPQFERAGEFNDAVLSFLLEENDG